MNQNITEIPVDYNPFASGPLEKAFHLLAEQKEILLSSIQHNEASNAYNLILILQFSKTPDLCILKQSLGQLIKRHESLRASIGIEDMMLCIAPKSLAIDLPVHDVSENTQADLILYDFVKNESKATFNLTSAPLLRAAFFLMPNNGGSLVLTMHHIIVDGWSLGVIADELSAIYSKLSASESIDSLPFPNQYSQFYLKKVQQLSAPEFKDTRAFWLNKFKEPVIPLEWPLPTGKKYPSKRTYRTSRVEKKIPEAIFHSLTPFAASHSSTLYAVCYAAYLILIHKITKQNDIVVGIPNSGQSFFDQLTLVGQCISTLPLRHNINPDQCFAQIVAETKRQIADIFKHPGLTYGDFLEAIDFRRDHGRTPLISSYFNYNMTKLNYRFGEIDVRYREGERLFETFEIYVHLIKDENGMRIAFQYNTDLFDHATISGWIDIYLTILQKAIENPLVKIESLDTLPESQKTTIEKWNQTACDIPALCLHELVQAKVSECPNSIAAVFNGETLTYAELDQRAGQLAHYLIAHGVSPNELVGICVERSIDMLVSVIGVLKSGAGYLPLDPEYPTERIAYILDDADAPWLISQSSLTESMPSHSGRTLLMDIDWPSIAAGSGNLEKMSTSKPDDIAYVIYTSGSTGNPKGVQVTHRNVVNFLFSMQKEPGIGATDRLLAVTTLSFDIHVLELFLPLVSGASVHIANRGMALDAEKLSKYLTDHDITVLQATPALWRMLLLSGWQGKRDLKALIGGEALPKDILHQLVGSVGELWNMYGPTETTVWSTGYNITDANHPIFIGKAIDNTQLYVLDPVGNLSPIGVPGELYIGGAGVTKGYLNQPELNEKAFVPNKFSDRGSDIIYRTGDLVKLNHNGLIEYLNRLDSQVKVRGFRIELEEVEACIAGHPMIEQTAVIVREPEPGNAMLVAYSVLRGQVYSRELRRFCEKKLPAYMVPQLFISIDEMPKTSNQKIDRKNLPEPVFNATPIDNREIAAPRNDLEISLLTAWQHVLNRADFGIHDRFLDIGGHSLQVVKLVREMHALTNIKFSYEDVFREQTVAALADSVSKEKNNSSFCLVPFNTSDSNKVIFYISGINVYAHLSREIGDAYRQFGVFVPEELELNENIPQVAAFVQRYIDAVINTVPKEVSLFLVGLSFGGIIAVEVSRQLRHLGYNVSQIVLLDTYRPDSAILSFKKVIKDLIKFDKYKHYSLKRIKKRFKHPSYETTQYNGQKIKQEGAYQFNRRGFMKAFLNYHSRITTPEDNILLIRSNFDNAGFGKAFKKQLGWEDTNTASLILKHIDAGHVQMMEEAYAPILAGIIKPIFDAHGTS